MLNATYKKILEKMPVGVFVFDGNLRVKYTNAFFRRVFSSKAKRGTPQSVFSCGEQAACGKNDACAYCAFYRAMKSAVETNEEQTETWQRQVTINGRVDKIASRVRIYPVEEGKLYLGLAESNYQSEMEREMLTAREMQMRLLPPAGKTVAGVNYAYLYVPCSEIGGDLPDVYQLGNNAYGVLADVSGHGVSGGMLSTFVKAGFDKSEPSLSKAMRGLSEKFCELNLDERSYITVASVCIDNDKRVLRYSLAGHNAPILLKNAYGIHEIELPAPPISNWMPDFAYEEKSIPFVNGDLLVLVTDGVTEAKNSAGEMFGIERVESVLLQSVNAEDFIAKLKAALGVYCSGKFTDDVTALAFDL